MKTKHLFITSIILFLYAANMAWAQDPEIIPVSITLPPGKWVSYCPHDITRIPQKGTENFPVGVYTATYSSSNSQQLVLTEINTGTNAVYIGKTISQSPIDYFGYLLKSTSDVEVTVSVQQSSSFSVNPIVGSDLYGNPQNTPVETSTLKSDGYYFLVLSANDQCFVQYAGQYFPANKAFLVVPENDYTPVGAPSIQIVEGPAVVTTIDSCEEEAAVTKAIRDGQLFIIRDGITYDVLGRTVR